MNKGRSNGEWHRQRELSADSWSGALASSKLIERLRNSPCSPPPPLPLFPTSSWPTCSLSSQFYLCFLLPGIVLQSTVGSCSLAVCRRRRCHHHHRLSPPLPQLSSLTIPLPCSWRLSIMSYNGPPSAKPLHRPRSLFVLSLILLSLLLPATTIASSSSSSQQTLRIGQDEYDVANQQVLVHTRRKILPRSHRSSFSSSSWFSKRASDPFSEFEEAVDFYNPNSYPGGQVLSIIPGNTTIGLGEPMNIIISGRSSKTVLGPVGLLLWSTSIDFGISCLGQSGGTEQLANLGDGRVNQTQGNGSGANGVLRYNYGSPYLGTCRVSDELQGGPPGRLMTS